MPIGLPVNGLINVSVNITPNAAQTLSFNSLLVLGDSAVIDTVQRYRTYSSLASVATDFGTSAPEYLAAQAYFGQIPQPNSLYIGRWASAATAGALVGGVFTTAQQAALITALQAISSGGVNLTINGTPRNLATLNFSGINNLNGAASVINTALGVNGTAVWNGSQFVITSATTGASSTLAFATTGAGTDVSATLKLTSGTAAYIVTGAIAESAVAAVTVFDGLPFNFYGLTVATPTAVTADYLAIAAYIEGSGNPHIFGITTQNTGALLSTDATSIGYQLKQLGYRRTFVQFSSTSPYAVASMLGRILTVNYLAQNSTITLAFKTEPGVGYELLNSSQAAALDANNYNYFVEYNNGTAVIRNGWTAGGYFIDETIGLDWLANDIQTTVYNVLYQSPTKVPQTDAGTNILVAACEASCARGVNNGLLAPGLWTVAGFGNLQPNTFLPKGFYVYAPPISTQSAGDRAARKSVPIQIAVKLAGAIQSVQISVIVNR